MIFVNVNIPGLLLLTALSTTHGADVRCGLSALEPSDLHAFSVGALTTRTRVDATNSKLFETTHFAIWYRTGNDSDALEAPWNAVAAGDTLPTFVKSIATDLERAWSLYVDTLGMRPPLGATVGTVIGGNTPAGLYPIELCRPERALAESNWVNRYYGLANLSSADPTRSTVLLSSRVLGTGWDYPLDTGGRLVTSYTSGDGWLQAMRATAVHELFHACQFRYETSVAHFLFEASAVAMEDRVLPSIQDHLYYLAGLFGQIEGKSVPTSGALVSIKSQAYRHGLYVMGLLQDEGESILPALWNDRASRAAGDPYGTTILGTMSSVLAGSGYSWRESIIRYGMRILVAGKRRNWTRGWSSVPAFHPWDNAVLAPVPNMFLALPDSFPASRRWTLEGGALKFVSDPDLPGDLQVSWIADDGAFLVRLDSIDGGFVRQDFPQGTTIVPASKRRNSVWIVGSDGTFPLAENPNRSASAQAYLSFSAPLVPVSVRAGEPFRYVFPKRPRGISGDSTGGQVLTGISQVTDSVLPVLDSGVFKPSAQQDAKGALLASAGNTWSLGDARGRLSLRDAALTFPGHGEPYAFTYSGALWNKLASRIVGDSNRVSWSALDLAAPNRLILSRQEDARSRMEKVYPNPSLADEPVHFKIQGDNAGMRLTILAADGALVRQWRDDELDPFLVWDLRNASGHRVVPGVYSWILSGKGAIERGRLLVAR